MIQITYLKPDEIERLRELDVLEEGDVVYKWIDDKVVAVPEKWTQAPMER